ncbi:MAG: hypothetical protein SGI72_02015 [Planctomycetota bacterium]|nr:hypothetical protein [Planctomycetota bacterium]
MSSDPQLRKLALKDGRYAPEAFQFLYDSLDPAVRLAGRDEEEGTARHVTGQELLSGMRVHAIEQFGPLAGAVWRAWGIRDTLDWGRIVFLLVEEGLLNRQDSDSIEDFRAGFDFDTAFVKSYQPKLPAELFTPHGGEGPS